MRGLPRSKLALSRAVTGTCVGLLFATAVSATDLSLFYNVRGYTWSDAGMVQFEALLFDKSGRVVGTGRESEFADRNDLTRIDGGGAVMLPGLTDAHGHIMNLGHARLTVDLVGAGDVEEALERIAQFATENPKLPWIQGRGWNQVLWPEQVFPTAGDLDSVVSDRPVWLERIDGHAAWANSRAMEIAGIDTQTDPEGGHIARDENGRLTGVFVDTAMGLVSRVIPPPTAADHERALEVAVAELNRLGITGVHDAGVDVDDVERYRKFADEGRLHIRIYAMLSEAQENLDAFDKPLLGYADDRLTVRSVKLYADGALGSRGAALLEPYTDDPGNRGLLRHDQAALTNSVRKAIDKGFQVSIHAIGDAGNRAALDAFVDADACGPSPLRHRIEHSQVVALNDIPRFKALGIIASMQPTHATSDMNMAEDRVGHERIQGAYAWRRFLDQGTVIAAGSDFPVEHPNPFHGLYSATTRMDHQGRPPGGWYADQAMTLAEALRAFTLDAAYAGHQENQLGSLEPGKWADFILIDRDIFEVPTAELWQVQVLETWVGGLRVYADGA